jgi:RNA polymerase sigma-70 factor (ECF subfamily)
LTAEHQFSSSTAPADIFATTHWTVVLAAGKRSTPQADLALEQLCKTYWFPLYAYARRRGHGKEDAEDLTQGFFRQLLERRWFADADRSKGRLRAFLITAFKRFMANEWRRASAQKRGGGKIHLPMDTVFAEGRYAADTTPQLTAEAMFDRQWALTLLDLTIRKLDAEFAQAGKSGEFAVLKNCLVAAHRAIDYDAVAVGLGAGTGAARVAVHRLRKRFRELYRRKVLQTLPPGADLEDELRHLASSLAAA